jgi:hypothetical protein
LTANPSIDPITRRVVSDKAEENVIECPAYWMTRIEVEGNEADAIMLRHLAQKDSLEKRPRKIRNG